MAKKGFLISVDIDTDKSEEHIIKALKRGIYVELDNRRVASPKNVKINYCQRR